MLTFKQLEAVYWIARLGSFAAAANKLHTTQSAISKRVGELEQLLKVPLFDRNLRTARLTEKGMEILVLGEEILQLRERLLASAACESITVKRFRIGVTELTALSWLPKFVQAFRSAYPAVDLQPEIDLSIDLCDRLAQGKLDLIMVPPVFNDSNFSALPLKELSLSWMCSPNLGVPKKRMALAEIAAFPILMQIERSGVDVGYERWFRECGVAIQRMYAGNSLISLSTLTMAGFGISFLPSEYFSDLVEQGQLRLLHSTDPLPRVRYHAVFRNDGPTAFARKVALMAQQHCDFSKPVLTKPKPGKARSSNRTKA